MSVHTCPRCELRFERQVELEAHLRDDHGIDTDPPVEVNPPSPEQ